ncbi:MAG: flavin reductase family protein [Actinobacteria bacterium]|nr:flavin reductase family protein [Actinomycetota bacterium]
MSVEPQALRAVAARLAAGVAVVTVGWRGSVHAATVSTVQVLSQEPALLGVALHVDSRIAEAIEDSPTWSVSVLADDQGPLAEWLASPGRPVVGQLERVPSRPAREGSGRWLDGAAAWFDCSTVQSHLVGDHLLVVGQVLVADQGEPTVGALVHLRGRTRGLR